MARHASRLVAVVVIVGALLFVGLAARASRTPEAVSVDAPATTLEFRGSGAGAYLTGDLVGDANPAEVYSALAG